MFLSLSLMTLLLFQDGHDHDTNTFTPFPPGSEINIGSFRVIVPDGVFFADEDNAHHMYGLTGADFIPNCAGIFFSNSGVFKYAVVVQHFPYQPFLLQPDMSTENFTAFFTRRHLYRQNPVNPEDALVIQDPYVDPNQGTFSVAMRYTETDRISMYYRKMIWVSGRDALVLSLRAQEEGWFSDEEAIESIFQSVVRRELEDEAPLELEAASYLSLLGMNVSRQAPSEAPQEGVPMSVYLTSGALVVFSILILIFAVRMLKSQQNQKATTDDDGAETSD